MSVVDLGAVSKHLTIGTEARTLLEKSEREAQAHLSLRWNGHLLHADAFVVMHSLVRGPAKGGIRISQQASLEETRRLAELMTYKCALARIPFGGGKSGICIDPRGLSADERRALVVEYVHVFGHYFNSQTYVPAPDLGSTPADMATIYGQTHAPETVTGKPFRVGGLPGRNEATGYGAAHVTKLSAERLLGAQMRDLTAAVQGFGNVGRWTAKFLKDLGMRVVALSDVTGAVYQECGINIDAIMDVPSIAETGLPETDPEGILTLPVDVIIPAACENVIDGKTAEKISASMVIEAANDPTDAEADRILSERGIRVIPDILANAGGVIASYIEWRQAKSGSLTDRLETYDAIKRQITLAFDEVTATADSLGVSHRLAAQIVAVDEVVQSMRDRGWI